uniref:Uncharacterized protein n=1 Tax=Acrobeloides nanus TaxID=290746 RepID=A0A914EPB5_9BILA
MEQTKTHRYKNLCRSIDFVFGPKKYFLNLREGRKEIFVRIGELYLDSTKNKSHEIYMSVSVAKFLLEELREIINVIKKNEGTSPEQKKLLYKKNFFDENNGQVYILELMVRSQEFLGKLGEMTLCIIEESINDKTKKTVFFIPSKGIPIFQKKLSMILKIYDERLKSDKNRYQQEVTTKIEEPKE